jgi:hypothetical protein
MADAPTVTVEGGEIVKYVSYSCAQMRVKNHNPAHPMRWAPAEFFEPEMPEMGIMRSSRSPGGIITPSASSRPSFGGRGEGGE